MQEKPSEKLHSKEENTSGLGSKWGGVEDDERVR